MMPVSDAQETHPAALKGNSASMARRAWVAEQAPTALPHRRPVLRTSVLSATQEPMKAAPPTKSVSAAPAVCNVSVTATALHQTRFVALTITAMSAPGIQPAALLASSACRTAASVLFAAATPTARLPDWGDACPTGPDVSSARKVVATMMCVKGLFFLVIVIIGYILKEFRDFCARRSARRLRFDWRIIEI